MMYLWLFLGLAILIVAGEFLVKGAVGLSIMMKLTPLVIGMTVVSFGTSMPELLVSVNSAVAGNPGIAIGNVVGSNIANIAFILGLAVILLPIVADKQTKKVDYPMMLIASVLFYVVALDNMVERWEGIALFVILVVFITRMIRKSRKSEKKRIAEITDEDVANIDGVLPVWKSLTYLLIGLVGLYFGADWFVSGAVDIAKSFDLSDAIIGVTVVALGTSAPELVASLIAAYRKQSDLSVGNLIGSNVFNILGVIGITAIVKPIEVKQEVMDFDMLWMLGISLMLLPMLFFGEKIGRLKGVILSATYISYIVIIVLKIKGIF
jgi:cation:H+ antiporter